MTHLPLVRTAFGLVLAASVPCQTFVVDAAGGPGSSFTDLAAAVAAVPDGAVLLVRAGQYGSFTIQARSLTILCDAGAAFGNAAGASVTIRDLAANQRVYVRGLAASHGGLGFAATIECFDCVGAIVLDSLRESPSESLTIDATSCAQLQLIDCSVRGTQSPYALRTADSDVVVVDCEFAPRGPGFGAAIEHLSGRLQVTNSTILGAVVSFGVGGDALRMQGGAVRLDGTTTLTGGSGPSPAARGHAISGAGAVRLAPSVTLAGKLPLIPSTVTATTEDLASLHVEGAVLGGLMQATLTGGANQLGVLAVGPTSPPVVVAPGPDALWIVPAHMPYFGMLSSPLVAAVPVPALPSLLGATLGWQGATLETSGRLGVSNPVWFAVH